MDRRKFIRDASLLAGTAMLAPSIVRAQKPAAQFMTVLGPVTAEALGVTLIHEHVMADFIGAKQTGTHRYNVDEVIAKVLPYLVELKAAGCQTFVDCTPAFLGRDVRILKRLSQASQLNILTTTGYYTAAKENFVPAHAYTETAGQLSARWIDEWKNGIEGSGVYPGIIKTSVDEGPLIPVAKKILKAVAMTHLQTGLTISAHTGNGMAVMEELAIIKENGVHPSAFRWVHAQNEKDKDLYLRAAKMGAWLEFDGVNGADATNIAEHVACVKFMKENRMLDKVLISQDAGWYNVGEAGGGNFRPFTSLFTTFIPALKENGFTEKEINQLMVVNPRETLRIGVRKI